MTASTFNVLASTCYRWHGHKLPMRMFPNT